eukprot:gene9811-20409_t
MKNTFGRFPFSLPEILPSSLPPRSLRRISRLNVYDESIIGPKRNSTHRSSNVCLSSLPQEFKQFFELCITGKRKIEFSKSACRLHFSECQMNQKMRVSKAPKEILHIDPVMCKRKIASVGDANFFFRAVLAFDNKLDLLHNLSDTMLHGKVVLSQALSLSCSNPSNINSTLIRFLDYIGDKCLNIGSTKKCVSDLYLIVSNAPRLLTIIEESLERGQIKDPYVISQFLVSICRSEASCRENAHVLNIAQILKENGVRDSQLDTLLCSQTLEEERTDEDSRHDNDFLDYRKISIVPTANEINTRVSIYDIAANYMALANAEHENEASLLDRQFRLLREDMVAPMREEIQKELGVVKNKRKRMYDNPCVIRAILAPIPCILIKVPVPEAMQRRMTAMNNKNEKENFFENAGHRILSRDSLVAFITNNEVVNVGVIVRRMIKDEFIKEDGFFCVGVTFFGDSLINILSMIEKQDEDANASNRTTTSSQGAPVITMADVLFQATTSYFSYEPVLKCIQQISEIPFSEEIVRGQNPLPIQTTDQEGDDVSSSSQLTLQQRSRFAVPQRIRTGTGYSLPAEIRQMLENDPSQLRAVEMSLSQRVILIQGPPGTGKTFVGVQIAKSLMENNCRRILCLCYTNHALDSFLEELIKAGVPKTGIVGIGNSPKISEELQSCCLNKDNEERFDNQQKRRYAMLNQQEDALFEAFKVLETRAVNSSDWGKHSWPAVSKYFLKTPDKDLLDIYQELATAADVPLSSASTSTYRSYDNSFQSVGSQGRAVAPDYYWKRWYGGQSRDDNNNIINNNIEISHNFYRPRVLHTIWQMSKTERRALVKEWNDDNRRPMLEEIVNIMREYETTKRTIDELRNEAKLSVLRNALVIGCTTTSAAKNKSLLADVQLNAIMIEEAAEILEAHVLTTLTPSVKALIMIGDHKQLRPKLEHYSLCKDSGKGVDFDVSLFERLANRTGFPVSRLNIQHRMRPEISSIVRNTTYSDLADHPRVFNRDHIRGLDSDFLWIDHAEKEGNDVDKVELGSSSKFNLYEVGMVVEIVRYLGHQGYQPSDLVVLTPYLGQLVQIRSALVKASLAVDLDDADVSASLPLQLRSQSRSQKISNQKWTDKTKRPSVRVATIDNYQGEESKLVIASLVRSNVERDVGFVRTRTDGMIIVGDLTTFHEAKSARAKRLWRGIINQLADSNRLYYDGLPTKCICHGNIQFINTVEAFCLHVPGGGCNQRCTVILPHCPHSHICPKKCHPDALKPDSHKKVKCEEVLNEKCRNNHDVRRICHEKQHKRCEALVLEQCPKGHHNNRLCYLPAAKPCQACKRLEVEAEKARKQAELLRQQQAELLRQQQAELLR